MNPKMMRITIEELMVKYNIKPEDCICDFSSWKFIFGRKN